MFVFAMNSEEDPVKAVLSTPEVRIEYHDFSMKIRMHGRVAKTNSFCYSVAKGDSEQEACMDKTKLGFGNILGSVQMHIDESWFSIYWT